MRKGTLKPRPLPPRPPPPGTAIDPPTSPLPPPLSLRSRVHGRLTTKEWEGGPRAALGEHRARS
eukprot:6605484-Pyramimonas_sp.AAC.1